MKTCKEITKLVSQGQDRELILREKMAMQLHFVMCSACRRYARQIAFIGQACQMRARLPAKSPSHQR
jgi:predicted anti-sigma-YlaC factor YlaD